MAKISAAALPNQQSWQRINSVSSRHQTLRVAHRAWRAPLAGMRFSAHRGVMK